jgi:predicted SprT family Zn-dependent metalloprotease
VTLVTLPEFNTEVGTTDNPVSYDTKTSEMMGNPTRRTYGGLTAAYDFFNVELFGGQLPHCLITMQRHKGAFGYFSGKRFASLDDGTITDEIALNPAQFKGRTTMQTLSTLVHEMCHLWQFHLGQPGRTLYHNKQWAVKMREVGLIPTNTGLPGGKETGQRVTHMIEEGGPYARAYAKLEATGAAFLYHDRDDEKARQKKAASKTKYTCPTCQVNAWAKPKTSLVCGDCGDRMVSDATEADEGAS